MAEADRDEPRRLREGVEAGSHRRVMQRATAMDSSFLIRPDELTLRFLHPAPARALSYKTAGGDLAAWRATCQAKLAELLGLESSAPGEVTELRQATHQGVTVNALVMTVSEDLSVPAYLLLPETDAHPGTAAMAIHGHNVRTGAGCLGLEAGLYRGFAMALARAGYVVLLPIHRGFGVLRDVSAQRPGYRMDYEQSVHFPYVTDTFVHGRTVVGENVADLLRWEQWLAERRGIRRVLAAGLSYGGDLTFAYPVFSERVERLFASGSSGSFALHFCRCYNGPAHCVPGILEWMDRSDIAGLNAPRPLAVQYGELDTPCMNEPGDENWAAAYNESVPAFFDEARAIYAAAGAGDQIRLIVTPGVGHMRDTGALLAFFREAD